MFLDRILFSVAILIRSFLQIKTNWSSSGNFPTDKQCMYYYVCMYVCMSVIHIATEQRVKISRTFPSITLNTIKCNHRKPLQYITKTYLTTPFHKELVGRTQYIYKSNQKDKIHHLMQNQETYKHGGWQLGDAGSEMRRGSSGEGERGWMQMEQRCGRETVTGEGEGEQWWTENLGPWSFMAWPL